VSTDCAGGSLPQEKQGKGQKLESYMMWFDRSGAAASLLKGLKPVAWKECSP